MRRDHFNTRGLSIRSKLILSLSAIAVVLLVTAVISVLEYRSMSDYVTDEIGKNISCINATQKISVLADQYNHKILATVGSADSLAAVTTFDRKAAEEECQAAFDVLYTMQTMPGLDSLRTFFDAYIAETRELETVVRSTFVDSRKWFFTSLQPKFTAFATALEVYNENVHDNLMVKADEFEVGYYRSIIPGIVSVLAGLLLIAMLLFFLLANYVRPLYRMLDGLDDYSKHGKKYAYDFEGDDQLKKLNEQLTEIVDENAELKRRVKFLKEDKLHDEH